jgi:hypothetical protein
LVFPRLPLDHFVACFLDVFVTTCGGICMHREKINVSTILLASGRHEAAQPRLRIRLQSRERRVGLRE